ncbi:hypothetical protein J6590_026867 [Homalodisca vitripennis]|nr:hypothetical protein J6590_026867 [Homalodisca vitripennis]
MLTDRSDCIVKNAKDNSDYLFPQQLRIPTSWELFHNSKTPDCHTPPPTEPGTASSQPLASSLYHISGPFVDLPSESVFTTAARLAVGRRRRSRLTLRPFHGSGALRGWLGIMQSCRCRQPQWKCASQDHVTEVVLRGERDKQLL